MRTSTRTSKNGSLRRSSGPRLPSTQIILTTHSPHIVRAASPAAKLVWMRDGIVETEDDEAIRRLFGWGGLDKAALFFVEDGDDKPLRAVLRQWPDLARH